MSVITYTYRHYRINIHVLICAFCNAAVSSPNFMASDERINEYLASGFRPTQYNYSLVNNSIHAKKSFSSLSGRYHFMNSVVKLV